MKAKNKLCKIVSLFFVLLMFASALPLNAFATEAEQQPEEPAAGHALVVTSESLTVAENRKIQMTASVTNVETQPEIIWSSSDENIATVDANGVVRGVNVGRVIIYAKAVIGDETINGEFAISVTTRSSLLKSFLVKRQVLSYKYSYVDDFYYTNDKECWQYNFGFGKIYDIASPYILLEYDYVRVFFTYEDKDWMLQMWKGQYGMVFYGGEIGIYTRKHSEDGVGPWAMYACPAEENWLKMEMTLWHQELNGSWTREFSRDYDYYWWCTGFKNGHLRQQEPADELRLTGRITFKSEEMAKIVADGLTECGFKTNADKDRLGLDEYALEGSDIYFCWQNISEAESTMAIKVGAGFIGSLYLLPFFPLIAPYVGLFALGVMLVSAIL